MTQKNWTEDDRQRMSELLDLAENGTPEWHAEVARQGLSHVLRTPRDVPRWIMEGDIVEEGR